MKNINTYCELLEQHLGIVRKELVDTYLDSIENLNPERYFFLNIYRLSNLMYSIIFSLKNLSNFPQLSLGLELNLRTALNDCIIYYYMSVIPGSDVDSAINGLYSEHLTKVIDELRILGQIGGYANEQVQIEFQSLNESFAELFESPVDAGGKYKLKFPNGINIRKIILNELKDQFLAKEAYKLYMAYSKQAHMGLFSLDFATRIYNSDFAHTFYQDIDRSITIILDVINNTVELLSPGNSELKESLRSITRNINDEGNKLYNK